MFISTSDADRGASFSLVSAGLVAAALVAGASSCTSLDSPNDTCARVEGCLQQEIMTNLGDAGTDPLWKQDPQRWGCLSPQFTPPPLTPSAQPAISLSAVVLDYATLTPMEGLTVKFCLNMDPDCINAPQAVPVPTMTPVINIQVPNRGQPGYLRQEAPMHVIQDYYLLAPLVVDDATYAGGPTGQNVFSLLSETSITGFINDIGTQVDRSLGIINAAIVDCNGERVEGARLTLPDTNDRPELRTADGWAINNRFPVLGAATDKDGIAGLLNVPIGTVAVEASINGQAFGQTRLRVLGNRLTSATIRPLYLKGL